jgi:hypothetical protein
MSRGSDRRLAARHSQTLEVDLHTRKDRRRVHATDVSRHGLFLSCFEPPPLHHAVLLTVHLAGSPFETMATVVRRNDIDVRGQVGAGLKLFCLGADAKSRWDRYVASLEGVELKLPTRPTHHAACFMVQLETPAALFDFFTTSVMGHKTLYVSPAVRQIGAEVLFVLVHPLSHDELELTAEVVEYNPDHPLRMGVRFKNVDRAARRQFKGFIGPVPGSDVLNTSEIPLLPADRPSWTEYAFFSPHLRDRTGGVDDPTDILPLRGRTVPSQEEIQLLDVEQPDAPLESLTTGELDLIEGKLMELPELELVDKNELFDFSWTNESSEPKTPKR